MAPNPRTGRDPRQRPFRSGDAAALGALLLLTVALGLNRAIFDSWIVRHDIMTAYLPWYAHLGEELRAFRIPGWNPHQFSGTPFAGDPQSGWMYLPVMLPFALFNPVTAFKITVALELAVAGGGAYAFARVTGLRPLASLMTAIVFQCGPILFWTTYCCTVRVQLAVWVPLAMLGVDLALRDTTRANRLAALFIASFALGQMFAGWTGQGSLDGVLVVGSFLLFRTLLAPRRPNRTFRARATGFIATGAAITVLTTALGAAALLPRLDVNRATNLAGARYDQIAGYTVPPYRPIELVGNLLADDYLHRDLTIPAAALVLILVAPLLAGRRWGVPYFVALTVVGFALALPPWLLHQLFFLIPRWQVLHEHNPPHVTAAIGIGPAMLAGAAVQAMPSLVRLRHRWPYLLAPLLLIEAGALWADRVTPIGPTTHVAAAVATLVLCVRVYARRRVATVLPPLLIALVLIQPTGFELVDAFTSRGSLTGWERTLGSPDQLNAGVTLAGSETDPGGAGEFLQERLAVDGPFRYFGYGGLGYPDDPARSTNYTRRRLEPVVQAMLLNGRSIALGLYDVQGYNPVQLVRYVEFITTINGVTQDYHHANIRPGGIGSPLLDLLNVRYLVVDASIPPDRDDIRAITADRHEVFRTDLVVIYERNDPLGPAWIVHEVATVNTRADAVVAITEPDFDPAQQAVVEGSPPSVADAPGIREAATVVRYEPDRITIATESSAAGLLVVSEVYAAGWTAEIDGEPARILATDAILRGIPLPAGSHTVELRYNPRSLQVGVVLTGISTFAMLLAFGWAAWRRHKLAPSSKPQASSSKLQAPSPKLTANSS